MKWNMRALTSLTVLAACVPLYAQTADKGLHFDAASIRQIGPNPPWEGVIWRGGPGTNSPGRFTMPSATLAQIIAKAYDVWPDQVTGPGWITNRDSYAYAVSATMPASTTKEQFRAMLQNFLAERFHLRLHHVTQNRDGYELIVAPGGPKIREWSAPSSNTPFKPGPDAKGFPKMNPSSGPGSLMVTPRASGVVPIRSTQRLTMEMFCRDLGQSINMSQGLPYDANPPRVVDRTGLQGLYEFTLEYAGMVRSSSRPSASEESSATPAASDPAPNIFVAVEQQLGLKLRKLQRVSVDVLVVDSADKVPTAN